MTVHDEIVVECPDTEIEIVEDTMKTIMENTVSWEIPMSVEVGSGKTWRSAKQDAKNLGQYYQYIFSLNQKNLLHIRTFQLPNTFIAIHSNQTLDDLSTI